MQLVLDRHVILSYTSQGRCVSCNPFYKSAHSKNDFSERYFKVENYMTAHYYTYLYKYLICVFTTFDTLRPVNMFQKKSILTQVLLWSLTVWFCLDS